MGATKMHETCNYMVTTAAFTLGNKPPGQQASWATSLLGNKLAQFVHLNRKSLQLHYF